MDVTLASKAYRKQNLGYPAKLPQGKTSDKAQEPGDRVTLGFNGSQPNLIQRSWGKVKGLGKRLGLGKTSLKAGLAGAIPVLGMGASVWHGLKSREPDSILGSLIYGAPMNGIGSLFLAEGLASGSLAFGAVGAGLLLGAAAVTALVASNRPQSDHRQL